MPDRQRPAGASLLEQLPTERLLAQGQQLLGLLVERAIEKAFDSVDGLADRLLDYAHHGGPGLLSAIIGRSASDEDKPLLRTAVKSGVTRVSSGVKQTFSGVSGLGQHGRNGQHDQNGQDAPTISDARAINIAEQIDVGVPVRVAYDQWIRFPDFSQFMRMVSAVRPLPDGAANGQVQIFCARRDWDTAIIEQIPDERIVWRSRGARGSVDGAVSFHPVAPSMTRILLALVYRPQGLLELAGSLWHPQDRRIRLEIKKFTCHVMTRAIHGADPVEGWRDEIRNSAVVRTHEEARAGEAHEHQTGVADGEDAEKSDKPTGEHSGAVEENNYHDSTDGATGESAGESNDYDDADVGYHDADEEYDEADADEDEDDDPDEAYDDVDEDVDDVYDDVDEEEEDNDESERKYVPSGRR